MAPSQPFTSGVAAAHELLGLTRSDLALPPAAQRLRDRVAVVTGSSSGIGRAAVALFAAHGATVVGIDIVEQESETMGAFRSMYDDRIELLRADVGSPDDVAEAARAILDRHPRVDVLFNNAGTIDAFRTPIVDADFADWMRVARVNLTGPLLCTKALLPGLRVSGRGAVIHNSSVDGVWGNPHVPLYSISKGGLIPMTHVMAHEFARFGTRVNCIVPAGIRTGMSQAVDDAYVTQLAAATPLQRWGTSMEVARVALFLASDEASYITGAVIPVDGGRTALTQGTL